MQKQSGGFAVIALLVGLFVFPILLVAAGFGEAAWSIGWLFQLAAAPAALFFGIARLRGRV